MTQMSGVDIQYNTIGEEFAGTELEFANLTDPAESDFTRFFFLCTAAFIMVRYTRAADGDHFCRLYLAENELTVWRIPPQNFRVTLHVAPVHINEGVYVLYY